MIGKEELWNKTFSELNLQNKIVGDEIVDWSPGHSIAVATNKKIIICDTLLQSKSHEFAFKIENFSLPANYNENHTDESLQEFEDLCSKSSNLLAAPNFKVYEMQLNPVYMKTSQGANGGFNKVRFLPSLDNSLLAAQTLDFRMLLFQRTTKGVKPQWNQFADLSRMYLQYLKHIKTKDKQPGFADDLMVTSITCFAWSDVYAATDTGNRHYYLATGTRSGNIVIWKVPLPCCEVKSVKVVKVVYTNFDEVASLTFQKSFGQKTDSQPSTLKLISSNYDGLISVNVVSLKDDMTDNILTNSIVWDEKDFLVVKNLHWLKLDDGKRSVVLATKSFYLIALEWTEDCKTSKEFMLAFDSTITSLCFAGEFPKDHLLISCSDGSITSVNITLDPKVTLQKGETVNEMDEACYRSVAPVTYHAIVMSPNGGFAAIVRSYPQVTRSIQVDNTAFISIKRLLSPEQGLAILLEGIKDDSFNLFKNMDILEIMRQDYAIKSKFLTPFQSLLEAPVTKEESTVGLQFRWHLLHIKGKFEGHSVDLDTSNESESSGNEDIEAFLIIRQMIKVLECWCDSRPNPVCQIPTKSIVSWLEQNGELLTNEQTLVIKKTKLIKKYSSTFDSPTCYYTSQLMSLSSDGRFWISTDGSKWPLCCLTFTPLQRPSKRKCQLSGLFSDVNNSKNWTSKLLSSPCIFSQAPFV